MSNTIPMIPLSDTTPQRVREAMREAGYTSKALAAELEVHYNTISNIVTGKTPMDKRTAMAIAMTCAVPWRWLMYGDDSMCPRQDSNLRPRD